MKGTVRWYNEAKRFGFIQTETNQDVFVHFTGLANASEGLEPGQEVEFEVKQGDKGPIATNVRRTK
jgi:CspA family cold shock protein